LLRKDPNQFLKLIDDFDDFEFISFLETLCSLKYLSFFLKNLAIQKKIKNQLNKRKLTISESTYFLGFYKSFFKLKLLEKEKEVLKQQLERIRQEREVDWYYRNTAQVFALLSFALKISDFTEITSKPNDHFRYYDELGLYGTLFNNLILVGVGKKTLAEVVRDFRFYLIKNDQRVNGPYLRHNMSVLWAYLFSLQNEATYESLISLKSIIFINGERDLSAFAFDLNLRKINKTLFNQITNESEISQFESLLQHPGDYQELVDNCFNLSLLFSSFSEQKSLNYFIRGITEGVLRHGWRKDTLISYQLVSCLELLWQKNWATEEELKEYAKEVFVLTRRVADLTDGHSTWEGPYNVIDLVVKYNLALAIELKDKIIKEDGRRKFSNRAITSILLGKIHRGVSIDEIEKDMQEYRVSYDYENKPQSDSYEQKITAYVSIAETDLYTDEERKYAFESAYTQIEEMKNEKVSYYLNDSYFKKLKQKFIDLCKKYKKEPNTSIEIKEEIKPDSRLEQQFISKVKKVKTPRQIKSLYKHLENYDNRIVLAQKESWIILINKTFDICENIMPFTKLLERYSFPHTDFFTSNSEYFYFGLAAAVNNPQTRPEALHHLYKNTGHGGFKNIMKVYAEIGDKEMCKKLFQRYLQLCDFLVNLK
jgi:hypothetical protein